MPRRTSKHRLQRSPQTESASLLLKFPRGEVKQANIPIAKSSVYTSMGVPRGDRMFSRLSPHKHTRMSSFGTGSLLGTLILSLLIAAPISVAQGQSQTPSSQGQSSPPAAGSQQNPNQQEAPPEAGGPNSDTGPYAIPKKAEEPPPPPPPERPKKIEGMPDYSIHVDVPEVTVPVSVTTKDGQFVSNLKQENFRIYEDGVQQTIHDFKIEEAPITAVLLVEFASTNWPHGDGRPARLLRLRQHPEKGRLGRRRFL